MNVSRQMQDAVFQAALDLQDAATRQQFLDKACAGDALLRDSVEKMLADQAKAETFFAEKIPAVRASMGTADQLLNPAPAPAKPPDEQEGKRIGHYKLLQRLGEGGCGAVYMAEQEKPIHRRVALKIIKLGMDTRSVIARFDAERQALAMMDHPNIAHVLDAGATETGRPYFVMELVRGIRLTEYCDQNQLDTRQRLELFIQVCHAIQHAHQKGIIHRDIKPSNILVTLHDGVPVPKVIDFGIAKAIEGRLTDQTLFTAYEQLVGTPAYMSPEQAEMSGLDVDTRSDIYSLGVLLYELLTGRTPFDAKELVKSGLDQMRRTLREKEPQRPSNVLTTLQGPELRAMAACRHAEPPKLISLLKGDLDWIVMKALEKDRTRRYETANGLAMDIERYLGNEPVTARPPDRLYRFRKLVLRNQAVFLAGTITALALIIGLGLSTVLFLNEKELRREQVQLRVKAEQAEQREATLRRQAEANSKINQAAIYVSQQKFAEAAALLSEFKTLPPKPSYDGINAFRSVGIWLGQQGRWQEAADHFYPLLEIDKLDEWPVVSLDYQACGAVLAESNDRKRFGHFCQLAIDNYSFTTNGDLAGRILKACLLLPPSPELMQQLQPMADTTDKVFSPLPRGNFPGWATIHLALWNYRKGDYSRATDWCRRGTGYKGSALEATVLTIRAMASYQQGNRTDAHGYLQISRQLVEERFKSTLENGNNGDGYWYDWLFARVLLREATALTTDRN